MSPELDTSKRLFRCWISQQLVSLQGETDHHVSLLNLERSHEGRDVPWNGNTAQLCPREPKGLARDLRWNCGAWNFHLKDRDVLHFRGKPLLNGLFRVEKKNKSLDSGEPVLRMNINAIPANALQETIEADIRTFPYFARWKTKPDGSATAGLDFRIFVQQEL